jgi:hypothetical protein
MLEIIKRVDRAVARILNHDGQGEATLADYDEARVAHLDLAEALASIEEVKKVAIGEYMEVAAFLSKVGFYGHPSAPAPEPDEADAHTAADSHDPAAAPTPAADQPAPVHQASFDAGKAHGKMDGAAGVNAADTMKVPSSYDETSYKSGYADGQTEAKAPAQS